MAKSNHIVFYNSVSHINTILYFLKMSLHFLLPCSKLSINNTSAVSFLQESAARPPVSTPDVFLSRKTCKRIFTLKPS